MSELFSHAGPEMTGSSAAVPLPPARRASVTIPAARAAAFDGFTDLLHLWWPMSEFSSFGPGAYVGFENGALVEESDTGATNLWARVRDWVAPVSLVLDFFLGGDPQLPTRISIEFEDVAEGTELRLVQDGWPSGPQGAEAYEKYGDWERILASYGRFMGAKGNKFA